MIITGIETKVHLTLLNTRFLQNMIIRVKTGGIITSFKWGCLVKFADLLLILYFKPCCWVNFVNISLHSTDSTIFSCQYRCWPLFINENCLIPRLHFKPRVYWNSNENISKPRVCLNSNENISKPRVCLKITIWWNRELIQSNSQCFGHFHNVDYNSNILTFVILN